MLLLQVQMNSGPSYISILRKKSWSSARFPMLEQTETVFGSLPDRPKHGWQILGTLYFFRCFYKLLAPLDVKWWNFNQCQSTPRIFFWLYTSVWWSVLKWLNVVDLWSKYVNCVYWQQTQFNKNNCWWNVILIWRCWNQ